MAHVLCIEGFLIPNALSLRTSYVPFVCQNLRMGGTSAMTGKSLPKDVLPITRPWVET